MAKQLLSSKDLSDEDILKEFVKRFSCDGAVLMYLDSKSEFGFGRWRTGTGKAWVKDVLKAVKMNVYLNPDDSKTEDKIAMPL